MGLNETDVKHILKDSNFTEAQIDAIGEVIRENNEFIKQELNRVLMQLGQDVRLW